MKQVVIFFVLALSSVVFLLRTEFFDQLLSLLIVGLVPYTTIVISPLAMFFCWALLPILLFFAYQIIRGISLLALLVLEQAEYAIKARVDAKRPRSKKSATARRNSKKQPQTYSAHLSNAAHTAIKNVRTKFPKLPKQRYGKVSEL